MPWPYGVYSIDSSVSRLRCHIVSAEQHRAVGFEQSGV
jgi:hypothetical protein